MKIRVRYFAQLKDEAGKDQENFETSALNPEEIYEELTRRYSFTLTRDLIKPALNDEFCSWNQTVNEGDLVAFIPPVAGG